MLTKRIASSVIRIALPLSGLLLLPCNSAAQSFNFVAIDVPCSSAPPFNCPGGLAKRTALGGINPAGDGYGLALNTGIELLVRDQDVEDAEQILDLDASGELGLFYAD